MTSKKQKLELTWIGKENRAKLEPRILLEEPERAYHAPQRVTDADRKSPPLVRVAGGLKIAGSNQLGSSFNCDFLSPIFHIRAVGA
jgi:adenine-specific DNA-methyltransferase